MKLIQTTFFSSIITLIRLGSGFVSGKIIAILTGASGVAQIGAFGNFLSVVLTFASGGINTGVIKYTAEYKADEIKLRSIFSTSLKISVYCSLFIGALLLLFAPYFSYWIFSSSEFSKIIRVFGVTIIFYSVNSLLISILNGMGQIKTYTIVNAIGSFIGFIFTVFLVYFYKIYGALYALVLAQSIVFFFTLAILLNNTWFTWSYFNKAFDIIFAKKLSHYTLMAIVSTLTVPISQILLRNMLISCMGLDSAGYWQGMMRISDGYLMIITTSLSTYYLPKLSSLKSNKEIWREVFKAYTIILPSVLAGCLLLYFFRFFIIRTLFTADFIIMAELFFWQLVGDFFKMGSWILGYLMLAKAMTRTFIAIELLFSGSYVCFGYFFVDMYQLEGMSMAFALNYLILFLVMIIIFRIKFFDENE